MSHTWTTTQTIGLLCKTTPPLSSFPISSQRMPQCPESWKDPNVHTEAPSIACHIFVCLIFPITWLYMAPVQILTQSVEGQCCTMNLWNCPLEALLFTDNTKRQGTEVCALLLGAKLSFSSAAMPEIGISRRQPENGTKPQCVTKQRYVFTVVYCKWESRKKSEI